MVFVTPGGSEATLAALDAETGALKWKTAIVGGDAAAYSSIAVASVEGQRVFVQFVEGGVVGVDARTGRYLWRYDKANRTMAKIATPLTQGPYVYVVSAPVGGVLLRLRATDSGVDADQVYVRRGLPNSIGGAVLVSGVLYGTTADGLVAADFETGTIRWQHPSIGPSAVLYAQGQLYLHGENGDAALVDAAPTGYRERGRFTPPDRPSHPGDMAWTYPVLSNGRLYLREHGSLWAYDVRDGEKGNVAGVSRSRNSSSNASRSKGLSR
jgi:outer membrane protein assembly factor BamB